MTSTIVDYDNITNPNYLPSPATVTDNKKNTISFHSARKYSLAPVATIANATARQTVYDGFEFATGRNLLGGTASTSMAWTGQKSMPLSTTPIHKDTVDNAGKPYRVSGWVYGATSANVLFNLKDPGNNSVVATTTLTHTALATPQWTNATAAKSLAVRSHYTGW